MTTRELCLHAGINYRQADHWTSRGYLTAIRRGALGMKPASLSQALYRAGRGWRSA